MQSIEFRKRFQRNETVRELKHLWIHTTGHSKAIAAPDDESKMFAIGLTVPRGSNSAFRLVTV
jgi:hypothetical protein